MLSLATITLYSISLVLLLLKIEKKASAAASNQARLTLGLIFIAIATHAVSAFISIHTPLGFSFSIYKMPSLLFVVINTVVLLSCLRKPLQNLFIFLLPLSIISIGLSQLLVIPQTSVTHFSPGVMAHILLSIFAYSLMTIASLQALFLAYQNHQLKHKHLRGIMGILPPLQTMESLLFEFLWAGEILLTLSIVSGALFIENLLGQHLTHKTVFSILSWLIYATLLWGRLTLGWRGSAAIRWTLGGFAALMLAYFGSKLVLEVILSHA